MNILNTLRKNNTVKSCVYEERPTEFISTGCYTLNVLFSGQLFGGIQIGRMSSVVSPPSLGKSFIGLKVAKNAQQQHGMEVLYIDTEIAYDPSFAKNIGVDLEQMLVVQNNQIEDVIQIVSSTIKDLSKDERNKLLIVIDSWGGLVTSKTISDAIDGKDVTDMTIAKKKNSLARILNGLGSTCFIVNQTYECHSDVIKVKTPESPVLIKSIKTGDLVLTTDGFQAVTHTVSYPNVPIYRLTLEDGTTLESTEEHKYLRNGKWVKVSDLSCGDDIDRI